MMLESCNAGDVEESAIGPCIENAQQWYDHALRNWCESGGTV